MIKFKTSKQQSEWESGNVDLRLVYIIQWMQRYLEMVYPNYNITITDVYRSQEEQDNIYLNSDDPELVKKYKKKPWKSVHQYWRGVDIRTTDMRGKMAYRISNLLAQIPYDENRPQKKTAIFHNVGTGQHCHIQVKP